MMTQAEKDIEDELEAYLDSSLADADCKVIKFGGCTPYSAPSHIKLIDDDIHKANSHQARPVASLHSPTMPQKPKLNGHLLSSPAGPPSRAHLPQTQLQRYKLPIPHNKPPVESSKNKQTNHSHLIPVSALDVIYAPIFTFSHFNDVQTRCYDELIYSDTNVVVSAPTGCGKTVILELAIIKMLERKRNQMPSTTARDMKAM